MELSLRGAPNGVSEQTKQFQNLFYSVEMGLVLIISLLSFDISPGGREFA